MDDEASDWDGVHPLITLGPSQDTPQYFLVSKIYVANDNENLYIRVDTFEKPRVTVNHGEIPRWLYFFIDKDDDAAGDIHYHGADIYVEVKFFSRQDKFNNISYYAYTGEKKEWYEEWSLLSRSDNSSDFGQIFELKIPLAYLNVTPGKQIGIFIPWGLCQVLQRKMPEKEALSYPPATSATTSSLTTTIWTYSITSITAHTEITTTTPAPLFQVTDLRISPDTIKTGEKSTISVKVRNSGNAGGSYDVVLRVNGKIVNIKTVSLEAGQLIKVEFDYFPEKKGKYYIDVNGLTGILNATKEEYYEIPHIIIITTMILIAIVLLILAVMILRKKKRTPPPPPPNLHLPVNYEVAI